jgi:hypothetical protein
MDLSSPSEEDLRRIPHNRLNCLVCVAALGFGDIPSDAFVNAFNLIRPGGWIAFNIKEEFLGESDGTGFSRLIWLLETAGALSVRTKHRYQHRLGTDGEPIHYVAVVGKKLSDAPGRPMPGQPTNGDLNSSGANNTPHR